jgi:CRISPR-associated endonuclease Cas3-HD
MEMIYYAHSSEFDKSKWQTVKDHLENTARLALSPGEDTGLSEFAYIVASLHDIGKYSQAFQRRLDGSKHRVDHATAGVREITQIFKTEPQKVFANLLACCITGHHEGLTDYGSVTDVGG